MCPIDLLRSPCSNTNVTFHLYTRASINVSQEIVIESNGSVSLPESFRPTAETKIIIHGYNSDANLETLVEMREEYLKRASFNVIAVDWRALAAGPFYPFAVRNLPKVGEKLALIIKSLVKFGVSNIHVIGFSLGAHVPNYAVDHLKPYTIPRITGLDPAMPFFLTVGNDKKLDPTDARFVDVLHTNAFLQGKSEPSGHVDFYFNGGASQPGCWNDGFFGCNHERASVYFSESINSEIGFWGRPCADFFRYVIGACSSDRLPKVLVGERVDRASRGSFLVVTNSESPFAIANG